MHLTIGAMSANGGICGDVAQAAKHSKTVVLQTSAGTAFDALGIKYQTLDDIYNTALDFDNLLSAARERLAGDCVLFVTLGDMCSNRIACAAAEYVRAKGGSVTVLPHANAALCAAFAAGAADGTKGVSVFCASAFERAADTGVTVVINEINSRLAAGGLKLKLARQYGDEYSVFIADTRTMSGKNIPLFRLDAEPSYGYYTSVVLPPLPLEQKKRFTFSDLVDVMARLRSQNGCPWDKEQTHLSLKRYLIEESYEVLEAIDEGDPDALCDELGDVLLQVVFHSRIAQQQGCFDVSDVTTAICGKMISRHTHIFGGAPVDTSAAVLKNWEHIKKIEKGQRTASDVIKDVPKSMPALMRGGKVQQKAANAGFDFENASKAVDKLKEEIDELLRCTDTQSLFDEAGDLLFSAVNVVRLYGIDPETALQKATDKFVERFCAVETIAEQKGIDLKSGDLKTLDELWESAKKRV